MRGRGAVLPRVLAGGDGEPEPEEPNDRWISARAWKATLHNAKMLQAWRTDAEGANEYEVQEILAVRGKEGAREYRVSWAGYDSPADDTWEP